MWTNLVPFAAPAALSVAAIMAVIGQQRRPRSAVMIAELASVTAFLSAMAVAWSVMQNGTGTSEMIGWGAFGLSARIDAVSVAMLLLVSFIGWVVVRYAATYLDGEAAHGRFMALLCATLASVMLLVTSGNLVQLAASWVATSLFLHKLLLFYPARIAAQRAARKKFVAARAGDAALLAAAALLAYGSATTDISTILETARVSGDHGYFTIGEVRGSAIQGERLLH
jgi:NAD(P)H-quinone oxidoreductase subunit 5